MRDSLRIKLTKDILTGDKMYRRINSYFFFVMVKTPLLIVGCAGFLLLHMGFPLVAVSGGYSLLWSVSLSCGTRALECAGFGSCGSQALGHRVGSGGMRA